MLLGNKDIDLWFAFDEKIQAKELLDRYRVLLDQSESERYHRFVFEKDRQQFLVTRALVRFVLSQYVRQISPEQWKFNHNEHGKPYIANQNLPLDLQFNVSHSKQLIVMAVTISNEIGVDVEYINRKAINLDIAERFFSPSEAQQLGKLPADEQPGRFLDLWTLKEAYIKACGKGLSIPLDSFSFKFTDKGLPTIRFETQRNDSEENWHFFRTESDKTHKVALAVQDFGRRDDFQLSTYRSTPLRNIDRFQCLIR